MQVKTITIHNLIHTQRFNAHFKTDNCCSRCHSGVESLEKTGFVVDADSHFLISFLEYCPVCHQMALREFPIVTKDRFKSGDFYLGDCHSNTFPYFETLTEFEQNISDLSPRFIEIYHQAEKAEQAGLSEICGMGYRKALEFLIKDYLIKNNPESEEEIAGELLSPSINRIENSKIKTLAKGSAWLGNDECHYIRKHEDYSIDDLKVFINAVVAFINSECAVDLAAGLLTSKKSN